MESVAASSRSARLALVLTLALVPSLVHAAVGRVQPGLAQTPPERLELGKTLRREAAGAEAHTYLIACAPRQFLHAIVVQKGVDVVVTLTAPGGRRVLKVDSPNGTEGTEPVFYVTEATGDYFLEVCTLDPNTARGVYTVTLEEVRTTTPSDDKKVIAEATHKEATLAPTKQIDEGARVSLVLYARAVSLFAEIKDLKAAASTLGRMAQIHHAIKDAQAAVEHYSRDATHMEAAGDARRQAVMILRLGQVQVTAATSCSSGNESSDGVRPERRRTFSRTAYV